LDRGPLRAGPDRLRPAAPAQDERQRVDQDRLAGAGLAREQVESWPQIEGQVADDGEIRDVQTAKHRTRRWVGPWRAGPSKSDSSTRIQGCQGRTRMLTFVARTGCAIARLTRETPRCRSSQGLSSPSPAAASMATSCG